MSVRSTIFTKADVTSAGAGALEADISTDPGDFTLHLKIYSLGAAKKATIAIEDTVNDFTAAIQRWVKQFIGPIDASAPVKVSIHSRELPGIRVGVTSAELRVNVTEVTSTPGLNMEAWIESGAAITVA